MSLIEIKNTNGAVLTVDMDHIICIANEEDVKGVAPEAGKVAVYLFGGLAIRTNEDYESLVKTYKEHKGSKNV